MGGRGGQGGNPEEIGAGSLREVGEDGAGAGRNGKNFATLAQYFAKGKAHRGGNCYGRGREPRVQGAGGGKFRPTCPLPPPPHYIFNAKQYHWESIALSGFHNLKHTDSKTRTTLYSMTDEQHPGEVLLLSSFG